MTLEISQTNVLLKNMRTIPENLPRSVYNFSDSLKDFIVTHKLARAIYLYYPRTQMVVGNLGCYKAESYYVLEGIPVRNDYQVWIEQVMAEHDSTFTLLPMPKGNKLCYVRKMRMDGKVDAVIVIEIDQAELLHAFEEAQHEHTVGSATGILLSGNLVASAGDQKLLKDVNALFTRWRDEPGKRLMQSGRFIFFNNSSFAGLSYVSIYSARELMRPVYIALLVCSIGALGCLLIGIAGSVYISRKNAKPMEKLLDKLGAGQNYTQDECQFITDKIDQMMMDKYKSEEKMQEHQMLLNGLFLDTVLHGELHSEGAVFSAAKRFEVNFEYPTYQLLVFACADCSIPESKDILKLLQNILFQSGLDGLVSAYRKRFVILLNTEEETPDLDVNLLLKDMMEQLYPSLPAHGAIGPCYDSMTNIITSYNCALLALTLEAPALNHPVVRYTKEMSRAGRGDSSVIQAFRYQRFMKSNMYKLSIL